jgi:hypothetical protein
MQEKRERQEDRRDEQREKKKEEEEYWNCDARMSWKMAKLSGSRATTEMWLIQISAGFVFGPGSSGI